MLPTIDLDYLKTVAPGHSIVNDGGMTCVLVPSFPLPEGFDRPCVDLLLRLAPGYPDVQPDMWWFNPAALRIDGVVIPATQATEGFFGRQWQRWSRHLNPGQWRPGIDSLQSYFTLIRKELLAAAPAKVA